MPKYGLDWHIRSKFVARLQKELNDERAAFERAAYPPPARDLMGERSSIFGAGAPCAAGYAHLYASGANFQLLRLLT